jgi:hypothetical protein
MAKNERGLFRLASILLPGLELGAPPLLCSMALFPTVASALTPYTVDNEWWTQEPKKVNRSGIRAS